MDYTIEQIKDKIETYKYQIECLNRVKPEMNTKVYHNLLKLWENQLKQANG